MVISKRSACLLLTAATVHLEAAASDGNYTMRMPTNDECERTNLQPQTIWDAVTTCSDFYGVLVNSHTHMAENPTASVMLVDTADTVNSVQECAENCFAKKKCQWFKLETAGATNTCSYYQHLELIEASVRNRDVIEQYGFVMGSDMAFLNQNVHNARGIFSFGGHSFYSTVDEDGSQVSIYVAGPDAKCTTTPLTLYRSFALNYQSEELREKIKSGDIINAMDDQFTLSSFLTATQSGTAIQILTDAVDVNGTGDVVRNGNPGTTFEYQLDRHGRVVQASAHLTYDSLLRKPGTRSKNAKGQAIRDQYCQAKYQNSFNRVHHSDAARKVDLDFQAGHLFGCQFTNPHGFFNFVPQSGDSNGNNGCWFHTELMTSRLLKMGCEGDTAVRLTYMNKPGNVSEVHDHLGVMMSKAEAHGIYHTTNMAKGLVQRPCGFFYRPIKMSMDFTITGAMADSKCRLALDVIKSNKGKFLEVDQSVGSVTITRAFAYWTFESMAFYEVRGMAAADWRSNQCYAETGKSFTNLTFDNAFDRTFLKIKTKEAVCLAMNHSKNLQLLRCDTTSSAMWWSFDGHALSNAAVPNCIKIPGDKGCVPATFKYVKNHVDFDGKTADIKDPAELVDGTIVNDGNKCLYIDPKSSALSWRPMKNANKCTIFQTTYQWDGVQQA